MTKLKTTIATSVAAGLAFAVVACGGAPPESQLQKELDAEEAAAEPQPPLEQQPPDMSPHALPGESLPMSDEPADAPADAPASAP